MREVGIAVGIMLALLGISSVTLLPFDQAFMLGWGLALVGLAFGVPTGLVYHVQLYRALQPRGELPSGWIWRPTRYHDRLRPHERFGVLSWCYAGALGFFVIVAGFVVLGVASATMVATLQA